MARKTSKTSTPAGEATTVSFTLPGTAAMAIGLEDLGEAHTDLVADVRLARYGVSYLVTASPATAKVILDKVVERASPKLPRGSGQPSSWGHGCRKAVPRIRKALAGAK